MNLYQPTITGSLSVSGSINISGSINVVGGGGTITGTASYATNADLLDGLDSTVFTLTSSFAAQTASFTAFTASILSYTASQNILNGTYTLTSSFAAQTASFTAFTSSVNTFTASINSFSASVLSYTSSLNAKTSSFATTGSNTFEGIQTINSNLIVTGSITAQTLVVQTITSSVDFVTGSTRFGSLLTNTHVFSGSVTMNPGGLFVSSSGNVGIGTSSPNRALEILNTSTQLRLSYDASTYSEIRSDSSGGLLVSAANSYIINYTSGSERMRITSGGNVGIGTSSPTSLLHLSSATATGTQYLMTSAGGGTAISYRQVANETTQQLNMAIESNHPMVFWTNSTERMRITSSGSVLIGSATDQGNWKCQVTGNFLVRGSSTGAVNAIYVDNSSGYELFSVRNDGFFRTGTQASAPYNFTSGGAANCVIDTDGALRRSTSSLKYKNNVRDYDKGLAEVLQMRPVYYKGKNDGDTQFAGLIAEEIHDLGLTEFVQYAEDGTPDALHYQNMIALLTKSIQELKAEFDTYKTTHP